MATTLAELVINYKKNKKKFKNTGQSVVSRCSPELYNSNDNFIALYARTRRSLNATNDHFTCERRPFARQRRRRRRYDSREVVARLMFIGKHCSARAIRQERLPLPAGQCCQNSPVTSSRRTAGRMVQPTAAYNLYGSHGAATWSSKNRVRQRGSGTFVRACVQLRCCVCVCACVDARNFLLFRHALDSSVLREIRSACFYVGFLDFLSGVIPRTRVRETKIKVYAETVTCSRSVLFFLVNYIYRRSSYRETRSAILTTTYPVRVKN